MPASNLPAIGVGMPKRDRDSSASYIIHAYHQLGFRRGRACNAQPKRIRGHHDGYSEKSERQYADEEQTCTRHIITTMERGLAINPYSAATGKSKGGKIN